MTNRNDIKLIPLADLISMLRDHPEEYPRPALAARAGLSKSTISRLLSRNPRKRDQNPKFDCINSLVTGLGGELMVALPPAPARHLPSHT